MAFAATIFMQENKKNKIIKGIISLQKEKSINSKIKKEIIKIAGKMK